MKLLTTAFPVEQSTKNNKEYDVKPSVTTDILKENTEQDNQNDTPQFLTAPANYFLYNNAFYNQLPAYQSYFYNSNYLLAPQFVSQISLLPAETTMSLSKPVAETTTKAPKKDIEMTTQRSRSLKISNPSKLQQAATETFVGDLKYDAPLLQAVQKINREFVIEEIRPIPGRHISSTVNRETVLAVQPQNNAAKQKQFKATKSFALNESQNSQLKTKNLKQKNPKENSKVKVESTGKTSTSGNVPHISFGTYFLPYFSQEHQQQEQLLAATVKKTKKPATLILEPHSKAVVGNGGTAISTPISKAYLKRGVSTNVYFNPESVAIAGVGGKAHAQADLELDVFN